jgi:hypothetical protein
LRLKSAIWVDALLRRTSVEGKFGAVLNRGADEAGAIYVAVNHLDGRFTLLAPPPGPSHDEIGERMWIRDHVQHLTWDEVREKMASRRRVDPDLWLVEVEDRNGLAGLVPEEDKKIPGSLRD